MNKFGPVLFVFACLLWFYTISASAHSHPLKFNKSKFWPVRENTAATIIQSPAQLEGLETKSEANKIILSFDLKTWKGGQVRLSNFTGKILQEIDINHRKIGFNLDHAAMGFYFITIEKDDQFQLIKLKKE